MKTGFCFSGATFGITWRGIVMFMLVLPFVSCLTPGSHDRSSSAPVAQSGEVDVSAAAAVHPILPIIPHRQFNVTDYGGIGDGNTLNTVAFTKAIEAIAQAGGGQLIVPPGVFVTGPFKLCSNLDLHLEQGAIIKAPDTFEALGLPNPDSFSTQAEVKAAFHVPAPLISGNKLHDVALTGRGTIDGSGKPWWQWSERAARKATKTQPNRIVYPRPHLVVINGCERLLVADLTLINSPMFHLVPRNINELTIERVKIRAPFDGSGPNTDAIDIGPGTNFWIHDCDIDTGDDDIVVKSGGTNILIENNIIKHGHGISIGSETTAGVHNMLVRHCSFDGTDNGIRLKSMRGAGGLVENVRYTDLQMNNVTNAVVLQLDYVDDNRPDFKGDPSKIPMIHNILLDHLTVIGSRNAGIIHGLPDSRITNIFLRDIALSAERDFDVRYADGLVYERVIRNIQPQNSKQQ